MWFKTNIKSLICLSVLVFYPALVQAGGPAKVPPHMRAAAGLYQKPDGSFCAVDTRGKKALTPSFVKPSLSSKSFMPKGVPVCNAKETKAFQQQAKGAYLESEDGAHLQRTMGGAVFGSVIKGLGVGCFFASGAHLFFRAMSFLMNRPAMNDKLAFTMQPSPRTEADAQPFCKACAVMDLAAGGAGGLMGAATVLESNDRAAAAAIKEVTADLQKEVVDIKKEQIHNELKQMSPEELQKKLQNSRNSIEKSSFKLIKTRTHVSRIAARLYNYSAEGYGRFNPVESTFKLKEIDRPGKGLEAKMIQADIAEHAKLKNLMDSLEKKVKRQTIRIDVWKNAMQNPPNSSSLMQAVETEAVRQTKALTPGELAELVPKDKVQAVMQKHSKTLQKYPGMTGFFSGVAGAVICNEGAAFMLTPEDTQI